MRLHARNRNRERYDLAALTACNAELATFVRPNKYGENSIDFANPAAVKVLNKALLNYYYGIEYWNFPDENLCPPIPGRADYIHLMADLLSEHNDGAIPLGVKIKGYDIGVGASCIYPLIGVIEYGWKFIASDIDAKSIASAKQIVSFNPLLKDNVDCRIQGEKCNYFSGVIETSEKVDFTICNPPFHPSAAVAQKGTRRKIKNLTGRIDKVPSRNFSGISNELICDGGEYKFIYHMILESKKWAKQCFWFSTLVSKQSNLKGIYQTLNKVKAKDIRTIEMATGNKSSRIAAWTYLTEGEQKEWSSTRWRT
jgi:23S rRNA (adenine1618-N6)-methyltransferase